MRLALLLLALAATQAHGKPLGNAAWVDPAGGVHPAFVTYEGPCFGTGHLNVTLVLPDRLEERHHLANGVATPGTCDAFPAYVRVLGSGPNDDFALAGTEGAEGAITRLAGPYFGGTLLVNGEP